MKILILQDDFPPYENGGAGVMAHLIAKSLVAQGQEVSVITTVQKKELVGTFKEGGMTIHRIYSKYHERWRPYLSLYNPQTIPEVKKILTKIKPDIVHAHNIHYHLSYHCLKLARHYTDKIFLTTHDIMTFYQGTYTEFIDKTDLSIPKNFNYKASWVTRLKAFKKRFNPFHNILVKHYLSGVKIVTVSHALREALAQNGITNTVVVHNGIDVENWPEPIWGQEIILFGGRLSGAKGGDLILQALSRIVQKRPQAKLVIFGKKDEYTKRIITRAKELHVENSIDIVGWDGEEALKKQYAIATVAVVPSVCFDSFPTINLQAFASKKPVVATCFGGSDEIVRTGENGFIVNPFDVDALAKSILFFLENPEKAKEFGQNGYELVKREFSLQEMGSIYLQLFQFVNR